MKCIRCGKDLGKATDGNADYITANEFLVIEPRTHFYAIQKTGARDEDEREILVKKVEDSIILTNIKRVEARLENVSIQKTGLVCLDDFNPAADTVIWGYHKEQA